MRKSYKLKKLNKKGIAWRAIVLIILAILGLMVMLILIWKTKGSLRDGFDYIKGIF